MAIKSIFKKKPAKKGGSNVEHISDLCIITKDFTLINGEAEFTYELETMTRRRA